MKVRELIVELLDAPMDSEIEVYEDANDYSMIPSSVSVDGRYVTLNVVARDSKGV